MEESAVLNLLDSITSNETVRLKVLEVLNRPAPANTNADQDGDSGSQAGLTQAPLPEHPPTLDDPPDREGIQLGTNEHQLGSNSSLAANVHQSRGIGGLEANVLQSVANPLVAGDHPTMEPVVGTSSSFDLNSLSSNDEFTFNTHEVIKQYLETHFRSSLQKDVRSAMNKAHPVPCTSVMSVPKVDSFVLDHLKQRFPKSRDLELGTIQSPLLKCAGPLSCLWSELLDNNLLRMKGL